MVSNNTAYFIAQGLVIVSPLITMRLMTGEKLVYCKLVKLIKSASEFKEKMLNKNYDQWAVA